MENMFCKKCGSVSVRINNKGSQIGLYCNDCDSWIKWISKKDIVAAEKYIEENNKLLDIKTPISNEVEVMEVSKNHLTKLETMLKQKEFELEIDNNDTNKGIIIGLKFALAILKGEM